MEKITTKINVGEIPENVIILTPIASRYDEWLADKNHEELRRILPFLTSIGLPVDASRNFLIKRAIDIGAKKVLFLDADIEPPKNISRLFKYDEKIVSGIYWRYREPKVPVAFIVKDGEYIPIDPKNKKGLIEVDAIGMGCSLIDVSVFNDIEEPWFKFIFDSHGPNVISEDFYFCSKVREKFKIFVDPKIKCAHIGLFRYYSPRNIICY